MNTYSEKSITIGFMFTLVAFLGLANIIAIGVKGKRNAYILRLFSYRWNCSGITGQMPWRSNAGISRYSVSVWKLVPTRGNSVGCSIKERNRVRSCKLEISPGESSSMDSTGELERGCGSIWDTRWRPFITDSWRSAGCHWGRPSSGEDIEYVRRGLVGWTVKVYPPPRGDRVVDSAFREDHDAFRLREMTPRLCEDLDAFTIREERAESCNPVP